MEALNINTTTNDSSLNVTQTVEQTQDKKAILYAKKGVFLALFSGMLWSLNGITVAGSEKYAPFNVAQFWLLAPIICAGLHDCCAAIITTSINCSQGRYKEIGRSFVSKPGRFVIFGAIFGALLGMGGYMIAIKLAGSAYVVPITSLYPAVAAILAVFVLKERISLRAWGGLFFCVLGAITIAYTPPVSQTNSLFYIGLACAVLAAIGWGVEGVLATAGMDFIEPLVALNIYYIVSAIFYVLIIIPIASVCFLYDNGGLEVFTSFFVNKGVFFILLAACIGSVSYQSWYRSMCMTGVSRAMALNISSSLWVIFFSYFLTDLELTTNLIVGSVIIFMGIFLVIGNPKDMINLRKTD